jgi:poly(3-hydroxybutyrate) depolymerase
MITLEHLPEHHPGRALLTGRTIWFAARADARFSYGLYVPAAYRWDANLPVVIVVHNTNRDAQIERETWVEFAESHGAIIVTPLFPAAIGHDDDLDNYKTLEYNGIRFDLILLGMLDEISARWNADTRRVILTGHSGGAQFAQRFLLVHPDRLRGVAISAPGRITVIDSDAPWPRGTADIHSIFGRELDIAAIRAVPVLLAIGQNDVATGDLEAQNDPSQDGFGDSRMARLETLRDNLLANHVDAEIEVVPDLDHDDSPTLREMQQFVARVLART